MQERAANGSKNKYMQQDQREDILVFISSFLQTLHEPQKHAMLNNRLAGCIHTSNTGIFFSRRSEGHCQLSSSKQCSAFAGQYVTTAHMVPRLARLAARQGAVNLAHCASGKNPQRTGGAKGTSSGKNGTADC